MIVRGYDPEGVPLTVGSVFGVLHAGCNNVMAKNAINATRPNRMFRRRFLPTPANPRKAIPGTASQKA